MFKLLNKLILNLAIDWTIVIVLYMYIVVCSCIANRNRYQHQLSSTVKWEKSHFNTSKNTALLVCIIQSSFTVKLNLCSFAILANGKFDYLEASAWRANLKLAKMQIGTQTNQWDCFIRLAWVNICTMNLLLSFQPSSLSSSTSTSYSSFFW